MLAAGLLIGGVAMLAAARYAESYHSRRFQEHLDAMKSTYLHRGEQQAGVEHEKWLHDRRVELAVRLMTWGYPLGMLMVITGVALWMT